MVHRISTLASVRLGDCSRTTGLTLRIDGLIERLAMSHTVSVDDYAVTIEVAQRRFGAT